MKATATLRLTLAALALSSAHLACDDNLSNVRNTDEFAEESFSFEIPVVEQGFLELAGINGEIQIMGVPARTSITIEGVRRVESESVADAATNLERLQVVLTESPEGVRLRTDQPNNNNGRNFIVNYVVTLPSDLEVDVDNVNGRITVEDVQALCNVQNVNGVVDLIDLLGNTVVGVVNGEIQAEVTVPEDGFADLSTVNGNIVLDLPQSTSATLDASVTNGTVSVTGLTVSDVTQTPLSFTGVVGGGSATIELTAVNGTIQVRGS